MSIEATTWDVTVSAHYPAECDTAEITRALKLLVVPGERHELRALPSGRGQVISGDGLDAALACVRAVCDQQVYYSLNPVQSDADRANKKTVASRVWFLIDIDTIRPDKDVSATDEEKEASGQVVIAVLDYLQHQAWPAPVVVDSGNGWHLLYRINLPNDALSQQILKACLYHLAQKFDCDSALIDRATHDAPRIAKLPGTWARKGLEQPGRPHRICKIISEGGSQVVTIEQLQALGGEQKPANGTHDAGTWNVSVSSGKGLSGYVQSAIERECFRVAIAGPGTRNEALNRAAFSIGTFANWPELDEQDARSTLLRIGERAGLTPRECLLTIGSGWDAGAKQPRQRPAEPSVNGKAKAIVSGPLTIRGNQVKPQSVDWIWQNVIALNFMNLFAGRTGIGKSFVLCDVAARLSRGLPMPDGTGGGRTTNTLFISEDPYQYVLVPRLMELGADLSRIGFMRWEAMASYHLSDTELLQKAWEETDKPQNIVIDPPSNFLGGKDEHKNAETRSVLMKLVEWLENRPVAISLITHFNKGGAGKALDAIYRIMASVAWGSTSRVACGCETDPDDATRCIFGGIKNNLGPKAGVIGYRIEKTQDLAKVVWLGPVDSSIDDAINKVKKKTRAQNAAEWLADRFRERRAWPSDDLYDLGRGAGVSRSAIWEAAETLPLKREQISPQDGGKRYWHWTARPDWPPAKTNETLETLETLSRNPNGQNDIHSVSSWEGNRNAETTEGVSVSEFHSVSSVSSEAQRNEINETFKPF